MGTVNVPSEALKVCWTACGFSKPNEEYGVKLLVQEGELVTLLTDYRGIFVERSQLAVKFSALNAKLSAPDAVIVGKLRDLFAGASTKCDLSTTADESSIAVELENLSGRRLIKWRFEGHRIQDRGVTFYWHVVRPMMGMLSFAADLHRLEQIKGLPSNEDFEDPFGKESVRNFFALLTTSTHFTVQVARKGAEEVESEKDNGDEGEGTDGSLPPTPPPVNANDAVDNAPRGPKRILPDEPRHFENPTKLKEEDEDGSLPPTPPPMDVHALSTPEKTPLKSKAVASEVSPQKPTPKKRKLRF